MRPGVNAVFVKAFDSMPQRFGKILNAVKTSGPCQESVLMSFSACSLLKQWLAEPCEHEEGIGSVSNARAFHYFVWNPAFLRRQL